MLVLKSALSTISELLDSAFKLLVLRLHKDILTTVHPMTKSFVPFCSAQDGESVDINCLVF